MIKSKIDYMDEAAELSLVNIKNRKEITKKFVDYFVKNNFKRIQFVGSGSSYNIAKNASYFVQKVLNIPVSVNWAFTFLNYDIDYVEDDTLVILCSQGGFSTNTVGAARKLTKRSKKCIAFCKCTDTPLKDEVKLLIDYHFTAGDLSQTKGFVMSSLNSSSDMSPTFSSVSSAGFSPSWGAEVTVSSIVSNPGYCSTGIFFSLQAVNGNKRITIKTPVINAIILFIILPPFTLAHRIMLLTFINDCSYY